MDLCNFYSCLMADQKYSFTVKWADNGDSMQGYQQWSIQTWCHSSMLNHFWPLTQFSSYIVLHLCAILKTRKAYSLNFSTYTQVM